MTQTTLARDDRAVAEVLYREQVLLMALESLEGGVW